jgi:hypothetical protein
MKTTGPGSWHVALVRRSKMCLTLDGTRSPRNVDRNVNEWKDLSMPRIRGYVGLFLPVASTEAYRVPNASQNPSPFEQRPSQNLVRAHTKIKG